MSNSYYLVCMECKTGIHLGKTVCARYKDVNKDTYGFSSLGHTSGNSWHGTEESFADLQHFLILHRTHELRVLPDTVDVYATDLGFPHSFPCEENGDVQYSRSVFLQSDVGYPDPKKEMQNLPDDVVEKLKKF
jgi:hypothetical protein